MTTCGKAIETFDCVGAVCQAPAGPDGNCREHRLLAMLAAVRKERDEAVVAIKIAYVLSTTGTAAWRVLRDFLDRIDAKAKEGK